MKVKKAILAAFFSILISVTTGCFQEFKEIELQNIPFKISDDESEGINVIIENSSILIKNWLADAKYAGIVYSGKCQDILNLSGQFVVLFTEVRKHENWKGQPQVIFAWVVINTSSQTANVKIFDVTDQYPNTSLMPPITDFQYRIIIETAVEHLENLKKVDCEVTITQLDEKWSVLCQDYECYFQIDANSLEIVNGD